MKTMLISKLRITAIHTVFHTLVLSLVFCSGGPTDFDEVRQLIPLEGDEYISSRNELLQGRTQPWDQQVADGQDGDLGLAVFILNARLAEPDAFVSLDNTQLIKTRIGTLAYRPSISEGDAWNAFVIEHAWKHLWTDEMCESMIAGSIMEQDAKGSALMWDRYSGAAAPPLLRSIAVYSLGKYPDFRNRAEAVLAEAEASTLVKLGVFRALRMYKPAFGADMVVETITDWRNDSFLRSRAFSYLALDANDEYRTNLHQWLLDDEYSEETRLEIVHTLEIEQDVRDTFVYKQLLESDTCPDALCELVERLLAERGQLQ